MGASTPPTPPKHTGMNSRMVLIHSVDDHRVTLESPAYAKW